MGEYSAERWRRAQPVLDAALDCSAAERPLLLDRLCAGDGELRAEVERLLAACERADPEFLAQPASDFAAPLLAESEGPGAIRQHGGRIGPYRLVAEAGRGGMGVVYLAERDDAQFHQRVALKLARETFGDPQRLQRFLDERQMLASLDHPNIARLLDGGVTADGLPYFAMEYVHGVPIDRYCDEQRLDVEARLRLFCRVCEAVQYAHRNLLVHRDLKPSNILITEDGEPKLLDFGIARLLSVDEDQGVTGTGMRLLTPEYAAPEQLRGEPVTTAGDVYSLGVLLYRLLSGHRPYARAARLAGELEREIGGAPERPSLAVVRTRASSTAEAEPELPARVSGARGTTPEKLRRRLNGDLDTIVLRALHAEPERRYTTVRELADDIRRHLGGQPVLARPDTVGYRARKFVGRHRVGVAAGAVLALLLVGFSALTAVQAARLQAQAARVAAERDRAEHTTALLVELFSVSDPSVARGQSVTAREILDRGSALVDRELRSQPEAQAQMLDAMGRAFFGLGLYDDARPLLERALAIRRRLHPGHHPDVARSIYHLAYLHRNAGDFQTSESLYREALAMRRQLLGETDPELIASMNGLAYVLRGRGDFAEAADLYRDALRRGRRRFGDRHAEVTISLYGLATALRGLGDQVGAERFAREAVATNEALLGRDHPQTTIALYTLAVLFHENGRLDEAEPLLREVIETEGRVLGDAHPLMAVNHAGLARLLFDRGDLRGAEQRYRQALAIQQDALPAGHERIATTMVGLGQVLAESGRTAEAEPLLDEALAIRERTLRPGHWLIHEARSARGDYLSRVGRTLEAERFLRESYQALAKDRPAGDPVTRRALRALAEHQERVGRLDEAAQYRRLLAASNAVAERR